MFKIFSKIAKLIMNGRPAEVGFTGRDRGGQEWMRSPSANVDGTPMVGNTDVRGRSYGSSGGYGSSWRY
jgi:hypothetical protein